jgi:hypothetical protein
VTQLPQGLDTQIVGTGWPLSIVETMQLKLAAAIVSRPRVLVLTQAYDGMPEVFLLRAMDALQERGETTIVYFTYENIDLRFDSLPAPGLRGADHGGRLRRALRSHGARRASDARAPVDLRRDRRIHGPGGLSMAGYEYHAEKFTTLNSIGTPASAASGYPGLLFFFVVVALFLIYVPWVQTASGPGNGDGPESQ